jgi:hypothetical protein
MLSWPLRPATAQNQFRFGLGPQQQPSLMRRPAFGFGSGGIYYVS